MDGTLFFTSDERWLGVSDGKAAGTAIIKDIGSGRLAHTLIAVNRLLLLIGTDSTHGEELWRSDGSVAGTVLVKDIRPGTVSALCPQVSACIPKFTAANGTLFFVADDGASGRELWRSDGTAAGTVRVKDINPLPDVNGGGSAFFCERAYGPDPYTICRDQLAEVNGRLFFVASDGTALCTSITLLLPGTLAQRRHQRWYRAREGPER